MNKIIKTDALLLIALMSVISVIGCSDFFEQDVDDITYADKAHLNEATDTIYSVTGIMEKMQSLADRTIFLGELRGDLVDVNTNTDADLREIATFSIDDDNAYNSPRDYYAVINNCNYFIANADTSLKNNRNVYIFRKEYAAVKAYRAWTYLQLALNYGSVPFVTDPILTKEDSEKDYPMYDLEQICLYFIDDLYPWRTIDTPDYGTIRGNDSKLFYFPIYLIMGDMNLWIGNYREAALDYYYYLSLNDGYRPIGIRNAEWYRGSSKWQMSTDNWSEECFQEETSGTGYELITMIAGDSIPAEGNYSQLRNTFCTTDANDYKVSVVPSQAIINISAAQTYCMLNSENEVIYAPSGIGETGSHKDGDLRLSEAWSSSDNSGLIAAGSSSQQSRSYINKYTTQNVHIYRTAMVYLRMAEALNRAGFPRFAFEILSRGVNNDVLDERILPYYPDDAAWLEKFDFKSSQYILRTSAENTEENTEGLHSRGSGWTQYNAYYQMPDDSTLTGDDLLNYQIEAVEDLIMDEEALEFAFEGYRFYDLMRIALRRDDPAYLADKVYARRGSDHVSEMKALIPVDLTDTRTWYLNWNDKIGLGY